MKKKARKPQRTILYLHVDASTKLWLKRLCAKQAGRVSQSTMAEQVFVAARRLGIYDRKEKRKNG
jgi:hypothetical protein